MAVSSSYRVDYHGSPGLNWSDDDIVATTEAFRSVASSCFNGQVPEYQCLLGTRECLEDKVITIARSSDDGKIIGFCSAVLFHVPGLSDPVLHTGLTCVVPEARRLGLVRALLSSLLTNFALRSFRPWRTIWLTNLAAVVSSLGAFSSTFDDCYPSPRFPDAAPPSETHLLIARHFVANTDRITILNPKAEFDETKFVFEGANRGNMFAKDKGANPHRSNAVNTFFESRLDFERDDEMLQVAWLNLVVHWWRKLWMLSMSLLGGRYITRLTLPSIRGKKW
jgi:hypothetical protein